MKNVLKSFAVMMVVLLSLFLLRTKEKEIDSSWNIYQSSTMKRLTSSEQDFTQVIDKIVKEEQPQEIWSSEEFKQRLSEAFSMNDPCLVESILEEKHPVADSEIWSVGNSLLFNSTDGALDRLFSHAKSPLYGSAIEDSEDSTIQYFNALLYMDRLKGLPSDANPLRSYAKAKDIFSSLAEKDPTNGIYNFYLAQALKITGAEKREVDNAFIYSANAKNFDPIYQSIFDQYMKRSMDNVAKFAWAVRFLQKAAFPDFQYGARVLSNWAKESDTGKWIARRISNRLVSIGEKYRADSPGYLYSYQEYLIGTDLKLSVAGLKEKSWSDYAEKMQEARELISKRDNNVLDAESALYSSWLIEGQGGCSKAVWNNLLKTYALKTTAL
ncbi:MAG: hypothetical protein M9962_08510 [Oligoflexia bacterium]|nr:hypothetical protein [Oligoflexia bacterium]